jgi:hypothetical protein
VNHAALSHVNPWLLVAIVAAFFLLAAVLLVVTQQSLLHTLGGTLQGPRPMAPWGCSGAPGPC